MEAQPGARVQPGVRGQTGIRVDIGIQADFGARVEGMKYWGSVGQFSQRAPRLGVF